MLARPATRCPRRAFIEPRLQQAISGTRTQHTVATPTILLTLCEPTNRAEQEAKRVAEQVICAIAAERTEHQDDFSQVRVHTDSRVAEEPKAVNSLAYPIGGDIVLGRGSHAPSTSAGRELLAHELTHVVQQELSNTMQLNRADGLDARERQF